MPIIKKIITALFIFFSLGYILSIFLPSQWSVKRSIEIHAPAEQIFPLINNIHNWGRWYPWTKSMDVSMSVTYDGPDYGVGAVRKWTGTQIKPGRIEITGSQKNKSVSYKFTSENSNIDVNGHLEIHIQNQGCLVTWEDRGEIKRNLIARLFSGNIDSVIGPRFEEGLDKLKKAAENK
jgi:carbon monoxide dehydrogenase subunit G